MGSYSSVVIRHDRDPDRVQKALHLLETGGLVARIRDRTETASGLLISLDLNDRVFDDVDGLERTVSTVARSPGLQVALILAVSSTDSFLYIHWQSGRKVRELGLGVEEQFQWTRVEGEAEEWEAEAFDGEEVVGAGGERRKLGRAADGHIESPRIGDYSPPHAMEYADLRPALPYRRR
jgi:hypothetical protein